MAIIVARDAFLRTIVPLFTVGISTYLGGKISHSLIKNQVASAVGGAVDGVAQAVETAVKDILTHFNAKQLGKTFYQGMQDFFTGTGLDAQKVGKQVGDGVLKFIEGTGIQNIDGQRFLADAVKSMEQTLRNADFSKVTEALGEQLNDAGKAFLEGINIGEMGEQIGDELGEGLKQGTQGLGKEMRRAFYNTLGEVLKGITFDLLPYILIGSAACTATPLTIYYLYYRAKHNVGRPKLATEVYQRTIFTPLKESVKNVTSWALSSQTRPIYNAAITRRIAEITKSTQNLRKRGGYFQNVLFYGPGGTGKTMISELIAKNSGMSYLKMSGGDLAQYIKRGEHVTELNKLMDKMNLSWRPWSTRPWILFIDEAESLCRDRSQIPTAELLELQNAFLNRTGAQSKNVMIILSTNKMESLDEAVLSRMDYKIFIGPPAKRERVQILKMYVPRFFTKGEQSHFFTDLLVDKIAEKTEGLTGRAIFKLLNAIANKKMATEKGELSQFLIDETVTDFTEQEKEIADRKRAKTNSNHYS